jgi:hypothetical protein
LSVLEEWNSLGEVQRKIWCVHAGWKLISGGTERTFKCACRLETHYGNYRENFVVCMQAGSSLGEVQRELWSVHLSWKLSRGGTERTLVCACRLENQLGRYRENF